ncbi:PIN domain-containing protein [Thermococcus profundus]|uniref:PIN domain-containing protein n=1 Tax=Thermococcus profundus TaxID=49899 RepID=A0A2Z2MDX7_THEPR|nr:type II toxin-antitoxin system VapC family toxin [Thermococcus profundus]ASJ03739.1 PIN domain-containing protein [Thermococcus profundus]
MIVADASVLIKVLLKEPGWEEIGLGTDTATLDYALVEGMNAIWKAVRRNRITEENAKSLVTVLRLLGEGMLLFRAENFFERGLEIALKEGITIYDALYIALAEALNAELHTADEKQYYAARNYVKAKLAR